MSNPSVVHSTFTIERTYDASPERVFAAWADPASKRRWFAEGEGFELDSFELDFRVGGREHGQFRARGGMEMRNDTVYQDIVPDRRIVLAYTMTVNGKRISASLTTVVLEPAGTGTRLLFTEQAAFFEGADGVEMRTQGWRSLLEALDQELRQSN